MIEAFGTGGDYNLECMFLKSVGKLHVPHPDKPGQSYQYGTEWLKRSLPADIEAQVNNLCNEIEGNKKEISNETSKTGGHDMMANDIMEAMGITMTATFSKHAKYFPEDTETRDIYKITLWHNGESYSFTFGQSIAGTGTSPTAYDVLASIQKSDPGTFEDFCGDFGYDTDSRKGEKIYKAVADEYKNVSRLFTETELAELMNIS